jgi:Fic family protein
MDVEALRESPCGRLEPISGQDARWGPFSYFAYVPDPLPKDVPLKGATITSVADASMAVGRLDQAAAQLPNPWLLVRPALRKEALSTSALEGTYAPLTEILEGELVGGTGISASAGEVINYIRAAELGFDRLKERPISLSLLADLQMELVVGTRGESYDSGRLRERQVFIGSQSAPISDARFVPPPPGDLLVEGVSDWEKWIHEEGDIHLLVRVALGHYQFEALHPFYDGNGRLGRLVMALQLMEAGQMTYPLLNIAEWLEPRKEQYQDWLLRVSFSGDFDGWVAFICEGIKAQAEDAMGRIDRLASLRESILARVRASGSRGGTAYRIADELIGYPFLDVPFIARWQDVRYQTADEAARRLVEIGILTPAKRPGRTRKMFIAQEVLEELQR